ncbi:MAG: hypothetical protein WCL27_09855 [Betaproteobacteria bacterium]
MKIMVVAHDAGGAEIISSYIRQQDLKCRYVLAGPALNIFQRKLGVIDLQPSLSAIQEADWLLCGTSWQSELEWEAIDIARRLGKRSVAFLDHWVNYRERFVREGERHLPDELWVGDVQAEIMAHNLFPETTICLIENPYFSDLKRELTDLSSSREISKENLKILYVCEPIREHALREHGNERHWGYTEEEALEYFLENIEILGESVGRIVIRPHPSEPSGKYDWAGKTNKLPIFRGGAKPLFEEVAESDVVVGCESMAMVVGLLAGCRVISCIPPGGKDCELPQPEIESLQDLLQTKVTSAPR